MGATGIMNRLFHLFLDRHFVAEPVPFSVPEATYFERPTSEQWENCDQVLDWLRIEVVDEPGERDEVERVRDILSRVMQSVG